jgi:IPT/TIG domain-containing protein
LGAIAAFAFLLAAPGLAGAKPVLVGSPLKGEFHGGYFPNAGTYFNFSLADLNANVVSPVDGAVISFSVLGGEGGPYCLRVITPHADGAFTAGASTPPIFFGGSGGFRALKIKEGDTIALDVATEGKIAAMESPEAGYAAWVPPLPNGATLSPDGAVTGLELGFNAEVLPAPTVRRVAPKRLPAGKGGKVKIYGDDFQQVQRVTFGRVPVRFRVVSERLIEATAPSRENRLKTRVRVRTVAGTSKAGPGSGFLFRDQRGRPSTAVRVTTLLPDTGTPVSPASGAGWTRGRPKG